MHGRRYAGRFDRVALDFMQRLLTMEPRGRMTAAEALEHPYLRHFEQSAPVRIMGKPACQDEDASDA